MVSQDRQLVSLPDFSHYELYDKPEAVQEALEKVIPFQHPSGISFMRNIMKNVLILGAGGQIARHVINQLADKQTIKQTLFARQPAKSTNPIQLIARLLWEMY